MQKSPIGERLPLIGTALAVTLLCGFVLNAYYQTTVYYRSIVPSTRLAVFLGVDSAVAPEVIGERLMNLDGVTAADFVPREKALENAVAANPALKDLIPGENPLSSYYLVKPSRTGLVYAQDLKEKIRTLDGVEDVRFDAAAFSVAERLFAFGRAYRTGLIAIVLVLLAGLAVKAAAALMQRRHNYPQLAYSFVVGVLVSLSGVGIYYGLGYSLFTSDVLQMPGQYFLYQFVAGLAATLLLL